MKRFSIYHLGGLVVAFNLWNPCGLKASDDGAAETERQESVFRLVCGHGGCRTSSYSRGYSGYSSSMPRMSSQPGGYPAAASTGPAYAAYPTPPSAPSMQAPASTPAAPTTGGQIASPMPIQSTTSIVLTNLQSDVISYRLDGQACQLQSQYTQRLTTRPSWIVEFDRGRGLGMARYTLTEGTYEFVVTERGWDLVKNQERSALPAPTQVSNSNANNSLDRQVAPPVAPRPQSQSAGVVESTIRSTSRKSTFQQSGLSNAPLGNQFAIGQ